MMQITTQTILLLEKTGTCKQNIEYVYNDTTICEPPLTVHSKQRFKKL